MKLNRYHITPNSALGSPLKSDTLTGQLLCLYREEHGEEELEELIRKMKEGSPPFILSDAFPHDTLPFPTLPPISRQAFDQICEKNQMRINLKPSICKSNLKNNSAGLAWNNGDNFARDFR